MCNFSVSGMQEFGAQAWGGSLGKPLCTQRSRAACPAARRRTAGQPQYAREVLAGNLKAMTTATKP